jgi:hypothetical protein
MSPLPHVIILVRFLQLSEDVISFHFYILCYKIGGRLIILIGLSVVGRIGVLEVVQGERCVNSVGVKELFSSLFSQLQTLKLNLHDSSLSLSLGRLGGKNTFPD